MKKKFILITILSFIFCGHVSAESISADNIPEYSYIIGTQLFTDADNPIYSTVGMQDAVYDGSMMYVRTLMYGATTIDPYHYSDVIIFYKDMWGDWGEGLDGTPLTAPDSFEITHVNGICIDPSCEGGTGAEYSVTFTNTGGENVSISVPYMDKIDAADVPSLEDGVGYRFDYWEKDGQEFDFSTPITSDITLNAVWETIQYTFRYATTDDVSYQFSYNGIPGGNIQCNIVEESHLCKTADGTASRNGYNFLGWTLDGDVYVGANSSLVPILTNETEFVLYPQWEAIDYNITYDLNGGDETISAITGNVSGTYNIENRNSVVLTTPTRTGYDFEGWFIEGAKVTDIKNRLGEITLVAHWKAKEFDVTYKYNGNVHDTQECSYNDCVIDAEDPDDDNFVYWQGANGYYYTNGNNIFGVAEDIELIAISIDTTVTHSITYDVDGGDALPTNVIRTYVEGVGANLPVPTKSGYVFAGWYSGSTKVESIPASATTNYSLKAHWTQKKITIHYDLNGGTGSTFTNHDCVLNGNACNINTGTPTKTGYTFKGWSLNDQGDSGQDLIASGNDIHNIIYGNPSAASVTLTLHAIWEIITYNINYDLDGGAFASIPPTTYDVGHLTIDLVKPNKVDYNFSEWALTGETGTFSNDNTRLTVTGTARDFTLTPKWAGISFFVDYDLNGGEGSIQGRVCDTDTGCAITTDVPTREGYTFDGWVYNGYLFSSGEFTQFHGLGITDSTRTVTLVARWNNKKRYVIQYNLNGGSFNGNAINSYYEGDEGTLPTPTKEGYTFGGWKLNGNTVTTIEELGNTDVVLEADWNETLFNLTYSIPDGVTFSLNPTTYTCGYETGCVVTDVIPVRGTDFFLYWSDGENNYVGGDTINHQTSIVTLTPVFGEPLDVEFILYQGVLDPLPNVLAYGDNEIGIPTRDGYDFVGYLDQNDNFYQSDGDHVIVHAESNMVLRAVWTEKVFTLNFVTDPEDYTGTIAPVTKYYNETFTFGDSVMNIENLNGRKTLIGWSDGSTLYKRNDTITQVSGAITLNAVWTNTIDYDYAGGSLGEGITNPSTYDLEHLTINLNVPTKLGTTFAGWTLTGTEGSFNEENTVLTISGNVADITLTANWNAVSYNITYDYAGGDLLTGENNPGTYDMNNMPVELTIPTRDGYRFSGWSQNPVIGTFNEDGTEFTVTEEPQNVELTANWVQLYRVTYNYDGGVVQDDNNPQEFAPGDVVTVVEPTRTDRTFLKWKVDGIDGVEFVDHITDFEVPSGVNQDITLTAIWDNYVVSFNYTTMGGTRLATMDASYGDTISASYVLRNTQYFTYTVANFNWYYDEAHQNTVPNITTIPITTDVTYYGQYTNNPSW